MLVVRRWPVICCWVCTIGIDQSTGVPVVVGFCAHFLQQGGNFRTTRMWWRRVAEKSTRHRTALLHYTYTKSSVDSRQQQKQVTKQQVSTLSFLCKAPLLHTCLDQSGFKAGWDTTKMAAARSQVVECPLLSPNLTACISLIIIDDQSTHPSSEAACPVQGHTGLESILQARGGVHPGRVASPSQGSSQKIWITCTDCTHVRRFLAALWF